MPAAPPPTTAPTTRLVLRDGSTAGVRPASPSDHDDMRRFFDELSPPSRRLRFLAPAPASEELINRLCDNADPRNALTLVVCRRGDDGTQIVGVGSYFATSKKSAEVAFAVDDELHGKGIATALLERLARLGTEQDFEYFSASVLSENFEMLDVFRDSGFEVHSTTDQGCVEVRLLLRPSPASIAAADERDRQATVASLKAILQPRAVAVIGASRRDSNLGRRVFEALLSSGFSGQVYGVNPSVTELHGRRCYPTARDLPGGVDLAVIAVPRESVIAVIDDCAAAGVKGIVVISAGFAETDARGRELQAEAVERVRGYGMRMLGPNCMGVINTDPRTKPIVVVKAGRTPAGNRAAASHTAGLAASELTVDGLFQQSGVIRADTIDEMFDIAACLDSQPLPHGRRVAILTNAGGPGILAADACTAAGLDVLPTAAGMTNPLDLIASAGADAYREKLETLLDAQDVDAIIAIYTTIDSRRTEAILSAIRESVLSGRRRGGLQKPVLICTMASAGTPPLRAGEETIPVYDFPERAAHALGKAAAYAAWRAVPAGAYLPFPDMRLCEARELCREVSRMRGKTWLTTEELQRLLHAADLQLAPAVVSHSADEAVALARVFGFPVVAKIASAAAVHKTDIGGVRLHLATDKAVRAAYAELSAMANEKLGGVFEGILIQPMVTGGIETLAGLSQDPMFGPLIAFGLGGIHVELLRDVAFRIAPLTDRDADELMRSIKGFTLLQGYRNQPAVDLHALRDLLLKISYLGAQIPELLELEFNPVMALPEGRGCQIVDARARVGRAAVKS